MRPVRAPTTEADLLNNKFSMHRELRDRDHIVTLNIIAAELKRLDRYFQGLSLASIRYCIWRHIKKHGIVRRRVTCVAQNTRYEQSVVQGWVSYVSQSIKIGIYKACDVVNIGETDLASGMMRDGCGEQMIEYANTGSSARCTVLLGFTIIYKGVHILFFDQVRVEGP
jgi:hypothetical protein